MSHPEHPVLWVAMQAGSDAGETPSESVPVDGTPPSELPPAVQNAVLLIAVPVILLVAGALTYLVNRRRPSDPESRMTPGERGGLVLMGVGSLLIALMFIYLMLAQ